MKDKACVMEYVIVAVLVMRTVSPSSVSRLPSSPVVSLLGVGESSDAHHLTAPDPEGKGAEAAIEAALCWIALKRGKGLPPHCAGPVDASLAPFPVPTLGDERQIRTALSNSFAFGGSNATAIFGV